MDYILRSIINIAIVGMVIFPEESEMKKEHHVHNGTCPLQGSSNSSIDHIIIKKGEEFNWERSQIGLVLSAFFYSFIGSQLIGGILAKKFSAKNVIAVTLLTASILTILVPICARANVNLLILNRVAHGLVMGIFNPVIAHLASHWAPEQEKNLIISLPYCGTYIGVVLSSQATGFLSEFGFAGVWPSSFYLFGIVGIVWTIGWFLFVFDSPTLHPTILPVEKEYIKLNCHSTMGLEKFRFRDVPWLKMATNLPFIAFCLSQMSFNWNYYSIQVGLPIYLNDVLHMSLSLNGLLTSLPYFITMVTIVTTAPLSDFAIAKTKSTKLVRKCFFAGGMILSSICLLLISPVGCNIPLIICFFCLAVGFLGVAHNGWIVNHIDIAPQMASVSMAIGTLLGSFSGLFTPIVNGIITNEESTISTWQTVFSISAAVSIFGAGFFVIFADDKIQQYATLRSRSTIEKLEKTLTETTILGIFETDVVDVDDTVNAN